MHETTDDLNHYVFLGFKQCVNSPIIKTINLKQMKNYSILLLAATTAFFSACGGTQNQEKSSESQPKIGEEFCTYSFDKTNTSINWLAFKFTEKVGVGGVFDDFEIGNTSSNEHIPAVFKSATFSIPIDAINSNLEERDLKIKEFFFGTLNETTHLKGEVKSIDGDSKSGVMKVSLAMNGNFKDVDFSYSVEGFKFLIATTIDVSDWNAQTGIDKLNEVCYDLHKGADGTSKLWPEVNLEISTILEKKCL